MQRSGGTYCKNKLNSVRTGQQPRWNRIKRVFEHTCILILKSVLNVYSFVFEIHAISRYENKINPFFITCQCNFTFPSAVFLTVKLNTFRFKSKKHSRLFFNLLALMHPSKKSQGESSMDINMWQESTKKTEPDSMQRYAGKGQEEIEINWNTENSI